MKTWETIQPVVQRAQQRSALVGAGFLAVSAVFLFTNPTQFFRSYLFGYVFWIGIPLGSLALLMLHNLTGGGWGNPIRRIAEASTRTFPVMALLFITLFFGLPRLFPWARPEEVAADPLLQYKRPYLNTSFFSVRVLIYFAVWLTLAYFLNRWSREQDETGDPRIEERLEEISGPGLILYGLTVTFASIDWVMSLEPHWYSTVYGMIFMIVECMTAMAFMIVIGRWLAESEPLASAVSPSNWHDLGNLLLAFVMLWAYLSFAQFLLIWATNLKDEIPWYLSRWQTSWGVLAALLIVFHFVTPFLLLLFRSITTRMRLLARVGAGLLFISLLDVYWQMMPAFTPQGPRVHVNDLIAPIGIGGIWLSAFLWQLQARPLVPRQLAVSLERAAEHGD
jgi:hypothetical protein